MDAIVRGGSGDEDEGRPGEDTRFDERVPDAFPIARTRSRGGLEERGGTRRGQSMKVLIHQSSCTAVLGSPAERCGSWLWGDGKVSIQRERAWAAVQQRMA
jgi:hypothetical protein